MIGTCRQRPCRRYKGSCRCYWSEHHDGFSGHDPLFRFHRWLPNPRVLEIDDIKSVVYTPLSYPFVERLIGTIRREYLDRVFVWNTVELVRKLREFAVYHNGIRCH